MTTPLTDLLECPRDGGGITGMILCSGRITCATPAITTTHGCASVAKNGTGDYTVTFTAAFAAAPVAWVVAEGSADSLMAQLHSEPTTTVMRVLVFDDAGNAEDPTAIHVFALGA